MALTEEEKKELIANYNEKVSDFDKVTVEKADQLLKEEAGHIVYIGRENCPFCQKFVDKLGPLAAVKDLEVNYVDAKYPSNEEDLENFREKYDVPTVPGLLYSSKASGLTVKCDSSLSKEEILEIVEVD